MSLRLPLLLAAGILGSLLAGRATATEQPIVLSPSSAVESLSPGMSYFIEPSATASSRDVFRLIDGDAFKPLPDGRPTFGFVDGAYWFHVRLVNRDPAIDRRVLVVEYVLLDEIDVYVRRQDGSVEHFASGDMRPFAERALRYREPNFLIDTGENEQFDLLVRVLSKSSMQVPLVLYTQKAFFEMTRDTQLGVGLYYGILLALLLYNLILFVSLRDANYFYYILHVSGFGMVLLCLNGLAFEYLWPQSPRIANMAVPVSMAWGTICMHQFARTFLDLKSRFAAGNRVILGIMGFHAVMLVLSIFIDYRTAVLISTAAVLPGTAAILVIAVILARRGDTTARILLLAWSMLLAGTAAYAMVSLGILPKVFVTEYGIQIGSALEMVLLSFALAYRFAILRDENVRIVESARSELERRVTERTQELSDTLSELANANERLRESSLRDGLTGAYNRRYFDASFEPLLAECRAAGKPLSVLVADIDHFKRINDESGHLAGDDCLRLAADVVGQVVGKGGSVVRYGGEEFVVLLPGIGDAGMRECAETIRARIAGSSLPIADAAQAMTISIGGATVGPGESISANALLKRADSAMYRAKHEGRNRIAIA